MDDGINSAEEFLNDIVSQFIEWIPEIVGALLLLIVGYIVAKWVSRLVRRGLAHARLDERLQQAQGGALLRRAIPSPAGFAGALTFWAIFLGAVSLAITILGVPVLDDFLRSVYGYIPNVIAAVLIFLAASAVAAGVVTLVSNTMGDTPTGKFLGTITPVIVMGIAIFMILNQLQIATEIVTITYAAIIGSFALGTALAFGLGGRDVAGRILEDAYSKGREASAVAKVDVRKGMRRGKAMARNRRGQV